MFIIKKISKKAIGAIILVVILLIMLVVRFTACGFKKTTADSPTMGTYSLLAASNENCVDFLSQFGWQTDKTSVTTEKITIPQEFNKIYEKYNQLQHKQGLDLTRYKGTVCEKVSYKITNYNSQDEVIANLIIHDGVIIGGDICSTALDGFMHTFDDKES